MDPFIKVVAANSSSSKSHFIQGLSTNCIHFDTWASLVALGVKKLPSNAGDAGSLPGLGRSPGGGHDSPLQYCCLEKPHGQRSLVGYGCKELDVTEAT